jgi:hypothetical protein
MEDFARHHHHLHHYQVSVILFAVTMSRIGHWTRFVSSRTRSLSLSLLCVCLSFFILLFSLSLEGYCAHLNTTKTRLYYTHTRSTMPCTPSWCCSGPGSCSRTMYVHTCCDLFFLFQVLLSSFTQCYPRAAHTHTTNNVEQHGTTAYVLYNHCRHSSTRSTTLTWCTRRTSSSTASH